MRAARVIKGCATVLMLLVILYVMHEFHIRHKNIRGLNKEPTLDSNVHVAPPFIGVQGASDRGDKRQQDSFNKKSPDHDAAAALRDRALNINVLQTVRNEDKFGPHSSDAIVIVVQVHNRADHLEQLLNSLRRVTGIERATLVISMDMFVSEIDKVVDRVDFCRCMTIFFPFGKQLHPNSFPGEDPNDCPRDIDLVAARARGCNNAEYPDLYHHYREVNYVQIKHHWFWKLNMIFNGIKGFSAKNQTVLLLEEDYYVLPDILHCLQKALALQKEQCPQCLTISLGNYDKTQDYGRGNRVEIKGWNSPKHNMGMVITRKFFERLSACTNQFCDFDDYNWDWSLQAVAEKCIPDGLITISFKGTRVYHLGACDGTHSKTGCKPKDTVDSLAKILQNQKLYPDHLIVDIRSVTAIRTKPNGGWGDIRDRNLCKKYLSLCRTLLNP